MQRGRSRSPIRRDRDRRPDHSINGVKFNPNSDRMVYITNLNFNMEWKELKDIIREHAEVQFVEVLKNREGKSKGVAVVELVTKEGADKCIAALHRQTIGGRTLSAVEIRDPAAFFRKVKDDTGVDLNYRSGGGPGVKRRLPSRDRPSPGLPISGDTFGLSSNFLDSLNLKPPLVNRVFVTNISYTCSVGKLYDVFSMAGSITWFDLQLDKDGKSRGMAIVEYSHPIEAVQAISMLHNQRLLDRTLTVKMDRFEKEPDKDRHGLPNGLRHVGMGLGANGAPLKDIASIVGQVQQPAINAFSSNVAPLIQSSQPSFASYQPVQQQAVQQMPSVFDQPQFNQPAVQSYQPQAHIIRQASPPPTNYYGQTSNYQQVDQSPYGNTQASYTAKSENLGGNRNSYGNGAPIVNSSMNRQSLPGYQASIEQQSRVILIKNLPEDYTWSVIASRLRQFGEFETLDMINSGTCKCRFMTVQDAERARNALNGTVVENNMISVEYII